MIPEKTCCAQTGNGKKGTLQFILCQPLIFMNRSMLENIFKARRFITGFTGSAGTAVITRTKAGLWTDGRYFVQAAKQLEGTTVTLYRMGEEHVPTVDEYVEQTLKEGRDHRI